MSIFPPLHPYSVRVEVVNKEGNEFTDDPGKATMYFGLDLFFSKEISLSEVATKIMTAIVGTEE